MPKASPVVPAVLYSHSGTEAGEQQVQPTELVKDSTEEPIAWPACLGPIEAASEVIGAWNHCKLPLHKLGKSVQTKINNRIKPWGTILGLVDEQVFLVSFADNANVKEFITEMKPSFIRYHSTKLELVVPIFEHGAESQQASQLQIAKSAFLRGC